MMTISDINRIEAAWERKTENERSQREEREEIVDAIYAIARGPFMPKERNENES